ncbi:MAG: prolyl oligopeptidase family serine peptidase, partial [Spirochaetales bacterium]|nr:prolyl oligopeptidase family serine peptidase [Spirochaetales bacterium]
ALFLLILCLCFGCRSSYVPLSDVTVLSDGRFSCTFDGVKYDFIVDAPSVTEGSALVLMLPGYGGTAESFRQDTCFHEEANKKGYTVVYVTGAPDPSDSTSSTGWNYNGLNTGNNDVEYLVALASYIHENCHTDSSRCFVIGFSNGAFMCNWLAIEAQDTFSAVVSVSGSMQKTAWEERPRSLNMGLLQITGQKDEAIPKLSDNSAKYSIAPAIEDVIDYFVSSNGLTHSEATAIGKSSTIEKYSGDRTQKRVWHVLVSDGRHSWSAEDLTGIDTNKLILDFLETQ